MRFVWFVDDRCSSRGDCRRGDCRRVDGEDCFSRRGDVRGVARAEILVAILVEDRPADPSTLGKMGEIFVFFLFFAA